MQGNRAFIIKRKPRVILDKSFAITKKLDVGDKGQLLINGIVEEERLEFQEDGVERFVKTIRLLKAEEIDERQARDNATSSYA